MMLGTTMNDGHGSCPHRLYSLADEGRGERRERGRREMWGRERERNFVSSNTVYLFSQLTNKLFFTIMKKKKDLK